MVNIMPACVLYEGRCLSLGAVSDHYIGSGIGYDGLFRLGVLKIGYGRPFVLLKAIGAEECNVDLRELIRLVAGILRLPYCWDSACLR